MDAARLSYQQLLQAPAIHGGGQMVLPTNAAMHMVASAELPPPAAALVSWADGGRVCSAAVLREACACMHAGAWLACTVRCHHGSGELPARRWRQSVEQRSSLSRHTACLPSLPAQAMEVVDASGQAAAPLHADMLPPAGVPVVPVVEAGPQAVALYSMASGLEAEVSSQAAQTSGAGVEKSPKDKQRRQTGRWLPEEVEALIEGEP